MQTLCRRGLWQGCVAVMTGLLTSCHCCVRSTGHVQVYRTRWQLLVLCLMSWLSLRQLLLRPCCSVASISTWLLMCRLLMQPGRHGLWEGCLHKQVI